VAAEAHFDRLFKQHAVPEEIDTFSLPADDTVWVPALLCSSGLVSSNSEGRRMISQGAVKVNGVKLSEDSVLRTELMDAVVQVGKRRFLRLIE
jgi:tyrosyl-tRNA synthetase